jgi:tRNA-dihydrouridine synthase B
MLQLIKIGKIEIKTPIMLAPMAGITDYPFRRLVQNFGGAGLIFSEMIASRAILQNKEKDLKKLESDFEINAVQISGNDPGYMAEAAKLNQDLGADIIDINFGCPVKKVVKGFAGSAIMRNEKLAKEIIKAVVKAVKVPVTVKMRMGWDSEHLNAPIIAKIAENEGAKMVTVHGRTRSQMYDGVANWKFIAKVKKSVKIPVIANGDIKTSQNAEQCLKDSEADGIMIGRGIYGKPWLLKQISDYLQEGKITPEPSDEEKGKIALEHFKAMIEYYGEKTGVQLARKHISWYSAGMFGSGEFRNRINRLWDVEKIEREIREFWGLR